MTLPLTTKQPCCNQTQQMHKEMRQMASKSIGKAQKGVFIRRRSEDKDEELLLDVSPPPPTQENASIDITLTLYHYTHLLSNLIPIPLPPIVGPSLSYEEPSEAPGDSCFVASNDVNLLKEDVGNVLVWVKLHGVLVTAFTDDGLSVITTKLDGCPKNINSDVVKNMKKPSQTHRGVPVGPKVGFKPVKQVYRQVSNSNPFDVLNSVENNVDLGINGGNSNPVSKKANSSGSSFWNVEASSTSTTPIVEKINKMERLIIEGKVTLVDDEGKPLTKVDSSGDHDSEDEVASVDNNMANFLASKKDGCDQDIPDKIQDICDNFDITVRGRKKK
ncbi:hypothetical protein Tco_1154463 [Tanacetum coccineum]